jgi:folate-binding protein YgfZ
MTDPAADVADTAALAAELGALRRDVAGLWLDRDALRVAGPDAVAFLQGQCSQDVAALAVGGSAWSLVLQPQGKVDALVRATRTATDAVVLDTDAGFGDALVGRLARFKLRVEADIDRLEWRCLALRGPGAAALAATVAGPDVLVADASWPGLPGVDLLGPAPGVPAGVPLIGQATYQVARIEAGIPAMGAELTDKTIPAEAGIVERTVSFTKGCYTGQELVARIDSRGGHVPRHLRGVVIEGTAPVGASVVVGGKPAGTLTSVAVTPAGAVALAYIGRDVVPPAAATLTWEGGQAAARVEALPLVP